MSCSSPLAVWYDGFNVKTGKRVLRFQPNADRGQLADHPHDYVACGQCLGCLLDHARFWTNRCLMEMQDHKRTMFLTLTYDNEHLPKRSHYVHGYVDESTGELMKVPVCSLDLRDIQLWKKRLAKEWSKRSDKPLRFFGCGEYGDTTYRPHYHFLVFGLDLDENDLKYYKTSMAGTVSNKLYTCDWLSAVWGKGHVVIGEGTAESAGYVARYVLKKRVGLDRKWYDEQDLLPPFINMSRRPGIGLPYLEKCAEIIVTDQSIDDIVISTKKGHRTITVSGYMLDKLALVYPEIVEKVKGDRRMIMDERRAHLVYSHFDEPYPLILKKQGELLEARTKSLMMRGAVDIEK